MSCDTWTPQDKSLITFNDVGWWGRERRLCGAWCHRVTEAGNFKIDLPQNLLVESDDNQN